MLKTLKWIYNLGKKHEEARLYNALQDTLRRKQETSIPYFHDDKQRQQYEEHEQEINYRTSSLIDKVFHPVEYKEVETHRKNRFDETWID